MAMAIGKQFRAGLLIIAFIGSVSAAAAAQHGDHRHYSAALPAPKLAALLRAPIALKTGIGNSHERVTTGSDAAQRFYDQGLSYLYSYDWIHAARSFQRSTEFDPSLAMAYVGLSSALFELSDPDGALAMQAKAEAFRSPASPRERTRIALHAIQLKAAVTGDEAKATAYIHALDRALELNPADVQLLLLRGNASEPFAGGIGQQGTEESINYYQRVLEVEPDSAAAHHFLVHSYENTGNISLALHHASAYRKLSPSLPHAHHMYGHGLRRTGEERAAVAEFELARRLALQEFREEPDTLIYDWDYRHNLSMLAAAYRQQGLAARAETTLRVLSRLQPLNAMDELYRGQLASFLLRNGNYPGALLEATRLEQTKSPLTRLLGHTVAGNALLEMGESRRAAHEAATAEEEIKHVDSAWQEQILPWLDLLRFRLEARSANPAAIGERLEKLCSNPPMSSLDRWSETLFQCEYIGHVARKLGFEEVAGFAANAMMAQAPGYKGTRLALAALGRQKQHAAPAQSALK
jgi:DUF971 family protein